MNTAKKDASNQLAKRQRFDNGESPRQLRQLKLENGLKDAMGGRTYVNEEELTQQFLLEYLLKQRAEVFVIKTFEVNVETLSMENFVVEMDTKDNRVWVLKAAIEKKQGTKTHQQELFVDDRQLKDDHAIEGPCNVMLCVQPMPDSGLRWSKWSSGLALTGNPRLVIQKAVQEIGPPVRLATTSYVVQEGETIYGEAIVRCTRSLIGCFIGAARPTVDHDNFTKSPTYGYGDVDDNQTSYLLKLDSLFEGRRILSGDRVGVLITRTRGERSVRFFVNGVEFGKGHYYCRGKLVFAAGCSIRNQAGYSFTLIPDSKSPFALATPDSIIDLS
jgi:hypothetical protein